MVVKTKQVNKTTIYLGFQNGEFIVHGNNFSTGLLVGFTCSEALEFFEKFNLSFLAE
jgi:hypothetical protein